MFILSHSLKLQRRDTWFMYQSINLTTNYTLCADSSLSYSSQLQLDGPLGVWINAIQTDYGVHDLSHLQSTSNTNCYIMKWNYKCKIFISCGWLSTVWWLPTWIHTSGNWFHNLKRHVILAIKKSLILFQDIMQDKAMVKMSAVHNAGKSGSEWEIHIKCTKNWSTICHSHTIMPISMEGASFLNYMTVFMGHEACYILTLYSEISVHS
jgi:hypothetical protein